MSSSLTHHPNFINTIALSSNGSGHEATNLGVRVRLLPGQQIMDCKDFVIIYAKIYFLLTSQSLIDVIFVFFVHKYSFFIK